MQEVDGSYGPTCAIGITSKRNESYKKTRSTDRPGPRVEQIAGFKTTLVETMCEFKTLFEKEVKGVEALEKLNDFLEMIF